MCICLTSTFDIVVNDTIRVVPVSNVYVGLEMWLVFCFKCFCWLGNVVGFSVSNVSVGWEMWSVFSV
jgi:hypothetical protein